jgi:hypothetical protein
MDRLFRELRRSARQLTDMVSRGGASPRNCTNQNCRKGASDYSGSKADRAEDMSVDECVAQLIEQVDEIIAEKVADAVDRMRALGAAPEDVEAMLGWHIHEMARARQSILGKLPALVRGT